MAGSSEQEQKFLDIPPFVRKTRSTQPANSTIPLPPSESELDKPALLRKNPERFKEIAQSAVRK